MCSDGLYRSVLIDLICPRCKKHFKGVKIINRVFAAITGTCPYCGAHYSRIWHRKKS